MGHSNAKFDMEKCRWFNAQYLARLDAPSFDHLAIAWLLRQSPALPGTDDSRLVGALPLIQPKIKGITELASHLPMLFDGTLPIDDDTSAKLKAQPDLAHRLEVLHSHLAAAQEWTGSGLQAAIATAATTLSLKPGALMFPLRVLATGQSHGVDLLPALEWLGKKESLQRIQARTAMLLQ